MNSHTPILGLLTLERGQAADAPPLAPLPNTIFDPDVFRTPVIFEVADGATVERMVRGDHTLENSYLSAARRLEQRGATVIHSTCGFAYRFQRSVAAGVHVPVALSSLIMLPTLLRQVSASRKIAVLTYDSTRLGDDMLQIDEPESRARIVVGGIQGGKFWHDELKQPPPPIDVAAVRNEVSACAERILSENPEVAIFVLECGAFPVAAPAIRRLTGLPVFDTTTLCNMLLSTSAA